MASGRAYTRFDRGVPASTGGLVLDMPDEVASAPICDAGATARASADGPRGLRLLSPEAAPYGCHRTRCSARCDSTENSSVGKFNTGETRKHKYFRCSSWSNGEACEFSQSWPQELLYAECESAFLAKLGDTEVTERTYVPGKDNRGQIEELKAAIENLSQEIGQATSPAAITALCARAD